MASGAATVEIKFGDGARQRMLAGINILADTARKLNKRDKYEIIKLFGEMRHAHNKGSGLERALLEKNLRSKVRAILNRTAATLLGVIRRTAVFIAMHYKCKPALDGKADAHNEINTLSKIDFGLISQSIFLCQEKKFT